MPRQTWVDPDKRPSFIETYLYAVGTSEVPKVFHLWCAYSVMAACLGRAVWFEKHRGSKLLPNMYIFLIGSSGSGKNVAIDFAWDLLSPFEQYVNPYRGNLTAKGLLDEVGERPSITSNDMTPAKALWWVTPELGMSMGEKLYADSMVKHMTEMYSGKDYVLADRSRTSGKTVIRGPVFNWLAGTTEDWLIESIPRSAVEGGFFARCVPVMGERNYNIRYVRPIVPENYDELIRYLEDRIDEFCSVTGSFVMDNEAMEAEELWYTTRPVPDGEGLIATWTRQHDLSIKLAMLNSLADDPASGVIERRHIANAQRLSHIVMKNTPRIIELATMTSVGECIFDIESWIKKRNTATHTACLRAFSGRYNAKDITNAQISLEKQGKIIINPGEGRGKKGGRTLHWRGGGRLDGLSDKSR